MSIIDKLRAEIERRKDICNNIYERDKEKNFDMANYYHGKAVSLEELLTFLDTLKEQPVELEKEITDFIANHYTVDNYEGLTHHGEYLDTYDVEEIAKYFYSLGRQSKPNIEICPHSIKPKSFSMRKEQSVDLEKEMKELCDGTMSLTSMDIARHFYELGRNAK